MKLKNNEGKSWNWITIIHDQSIYKFESWNWNWITYAYLDTRWAVLANCYKWSYGPLKNGLINGFHWVYNPTYRGPITPFLTGWGPRRIINVFWPRGPPPSVVCWDVAQERNHPASNWPWCAGGNWMRKNTVQKKTCLSIIRTLNKQTYQIMIVIYIYMYIHVFTNYRYTYIYTQ